MKIGVQLFVTERKAITIESSDHEWPSECMQELEKGLLALRLEEVKSDLTRLFGDD